MTDAKCKSCNAPIIWARTTTGNMMPLNREPVMFGGNVVLKDGEAEVVAIGKGQYVSHFSTCPAAKRHRRKGK